MDRNTLFEDEENGDDRAVTPLVFLQEDEDDMDYVPDEDEDEDDDGDEEIPLEELQEAEEDNIATLEAITGESTSIRAIAHGALIKLVETQISSRMPPMMILRTKTKTRKSLRQYAQELVPMR